MDACIARGGISHVLSQARASLKNPSRPFTPRTNERPLFHGDDYRPGSRPSSSYSVVEQKALNSAVNTVPARKHSVNGGGPSGAALPPRPVVKSAQSRAPEQTPQVPKKTATATATAKHPDAAVPQSHDSADDTDDSGDESELPVSATRSDVHLLETSVELPSPDALARSAHSITKHLEELQREPTERITHQTLESLVCQLTEFTTSSGVFYPNSKASTARSPLSSNTSATSKVSDLRRQLFESLVELAVGPWHGSAKCVIAITPCILELFETAFGSDRSPDDEAVAKIVSLGKVLFVLSKETDNDGEFCNVRYVESTLSLMAATVTQANSRQKGKQSACPMRTLIYIAGTLKNVSNGDDKLLKLLATNGAIASLSDSLLWRSKDPSECKEIAQFLVQTTTILRNLSTSKAYLKQFTEAQVASRLCEMVECFLSHQELMVNVSRILGKLTLHEAPRAQINQHVERHLGNLLKLVDPHCNSTLVFSAPDEQDVAGNSNQADTKTQDVLLVRIFFVLGNLCASNDRNRQFVGEEAAGVPVLLQSLVYYAKKYVRFHQSAEGEGMKLGECADVLVKLVRLLANLAMNADLGMAINNHRNELAVLLDVLECAQASETGDDELVLNIVSCLTNLSYYCTSTTSATSQASDSFIEGYRLEITTLLSQILWDTNEEAVLEATRAFGNLTRFKDVLRAMGQNKVLDGFVILLDHSNREIVYTVCGVLMNAALDDYARSVLLDVRQVPSGVGDAVVIDARTLLVNILECAALDDVEMSCIAGKVLYNLLLTKKDTSAQRYLSSSEGQSLQRVITSVLRQMGPGCLEDDEGDDSSTSHRDLRGVLTQLKTNMTRNE